MNFSRKKIFKFILIVLALSVWGLVMFKFFGFENIETVAIPITEKVIISEIRSEPKYELKLDYEDPFLKNNRVFKKSSPTTLPVKKNITRFKKTNQEKVIQEEPIVWPEISYKGMGTNKSRIEETMAWIEFNGKMEIVNLYQVVNGYKVEQIYKDSLLISKDGEFKTYTKKK